MIDRNALASTASRLVSAKIEALEQIRGGGNNELFRIRTRHGDFALKRYAARGPGLPDRLVREFDALRFLAEAGETAIATPVAADRDAGVAAYEWIEGDRVEALSAVDLDAALAFLGRLHEYREHAPARRLLPAVEACIDPSELNAQIRSRLATLRAVDGGQGLAEFLCCKFEPALDALQFSSPSNTFIDQVSATLSPSDFGRHNMLRRSGGTLIFLDFEYFGWDDPVKLASDTLWHPGSQLDADQRARVRQHALTLYGADPNFMERFQRLTPLYGLRWALIVLAEFIPERWERRCRAGETRSWSEVKHVQLAKAHDFTERALLEVSTARSN